MKVDLKFVKDYCDLSKSEVYLWDVVETIKGIVDEEGETDRSIIVISGETRSSCSCIKYADLSAIIKNIKLSACYNLPKGTLKELEDAGRLIRYRDECYIENKFAHRDYRVLNIVRNATFNGKKVRYKIYCEQ
jgi:hypothetical protein